MNNDRKTEDSVVEPKWHLELRSRIRYRSNLFFISFFFPFIFSGFVITAELTVFILLHSDLNSPLVNDIIIISFLAWLVIFYLLIRKKIVKEWSRYDSFDLFANNCGTIALEIKRILLVPYYVYDFQALTSLRISSWFVRRKYKLPEDNDLKKSLKDLPRLSYKLNNLVNNLETNRDVLTKISDKLLEMGETIEKRKKPWISIDPINDVITLLKSGVVKPKNISRYKAYFKLKRITFILVDIISSVVAGCITFSVTKDIGVSIIAGLTAAGVVPVVVAGLKTI
jgi:hypothetical protein